MSKAARSNTRKAEEQGEIEFNQTVSDKGSGLGNGKEVENTKSGGEGPERKGKKTGCAATRRPTARPRKKLPNSPNPPGEKHSTDVGGGKWGGLLFADETRPVIRWHQVR